MDKDDHFAPEWLSAYYMPLNILQKDDVKNVVLASAKIPFVYKKSRHNNLGMIDGGFMSSSDNTPIKPLINAGFKKKIVVHLDYLKEKKYNIELSGDTMLFHIYPSNDLGFLLAIDEVKTRGRKDLVSL